jgi:hypothetical protein
MKNRRIKFRTWNNFTHIWDEISIPPNGVNSSGSEFVIQQDSNILDINNIHIFEGDIVKFKYLGSMSDPNFYEQSGEVIFEAGAFRVNNRILGFDNLVIQPEVIGNIFETPELLDSQSNKIEIDPERKPVSLKPKRGRPKKKS